MLCFRLAFSYFSDSFAFHNLLLFFRAVFFGLPLAVYFYALSRHFSSEAMTLQAGGVISPGNIDGRH